MNFRLITFLFLACGFLMTQGSTMAQTAQVQNGVGQVTLTRWALQHIMARHWPDSTATGAGKFKPESLRRASAT
jgi:hypothetical protein